MHTRNASVNRRKRRINFRIMVFNGVKIWFMFITQFICKLVLAEITDISKELSNKCLKRINFVHYFRTVFLW